MTAPVLFRNNGIRYQIARPTWADPITERLGESFAHEPMTSLLGVSAKEFGDLAALFIPECLGNDLSVVAVAEDGTDRVAGVLICRDFKSPMPSGIPHDFPWFLPIYEAVVAVDTAYEAQRPNLTAGQTIDLWMLAVDTAQFGRRGIGSHLIRLATEVAREREFGACVCECTGHFSQTAAERAGFTEMARVTYKDFAYQGKNIFADIPAPHTHLAFYERAF
jgi:ribosomal protein S18 acetylase RimI-like enzyme